MPEKDLYCSITIQIVSANRKGLPLEKFEDVDAIPLNGKIIKNGNQTTDIYFYTDDSNPYKNMKLDMDALKQYNRFIYPLSLFLDRIL